MSHHKGMSLFRISEEIESGIKLKFIIISVISGFEIILVVLGSVDYLAFHHKEKLRKTFSEEASPDRWRRIIISL